MKTLDRQPIVGKPTVCPATGKWGYDTKKEAEEALKVVRSSITKKSKGVPKRVYECPWCSKWHLTKQR